MPPEQNNNWRRAFYVTIAVFALFFIQHYVRRFGQPIETIYFSILFNSIALTGLSLISASYLMGPLARLSPSRWLKYRDLREPFGLIGLVFIITHIFLAFAILTPSYYPKFFLGSGKLSSLGEISILAGTIGLSIFLVIAATSLSSVATRMTERGWLFVQRSGLIAIILSVLHFGVFKWRNWFDFDQWHNFIPPGTFVVTVFIVFVFIVRVIAHFSKDR